MSNPNVPLQIIPDDQRIADANLLIRVAREDFEDGVEDASINAVDGLTDAIKTKYPDRVEIIDSTLERIEGLEGSKTPIEKGRLAISRLLEIDSIESTD